MLPVELAIVIIGFGIEIVVSMVGFLVHLPRGLLCSRHPASDPAAHGPHRKSRYGYQDDASEVRLLPPTLCIRR